VAAGDGVGVVVWKEGETQRRGDAEKKGTMTLVSHGAPVARDARPVPVILRNEEPVISSGI
jgi:hypothetical protein